MVLKAAWEVRAGIIPGQPMPEYTKRWMYTSQDKAIDDREASKDRQGYAYHAIYAKLRAEAIDYYIQMAMPQYNNWAEITFIWY